eukprot:363989-Chlamydomonas_euryale.AAC.5
MRACVRRHHALRPQPLGRDVALGVDARILRGVAALRHLHSPTKRKAAHTQRRVPQGATISKQSKEAINTSEAHIHWAKQCWLSWSGDAEDGKGEQRVGRGKGAGREGWKDALVDAAGVLKLDQRSKELPHQVSQQARCQRCPLPVHADLQIKKAAHKRTGQSHTFAHTFEKGTYQRVRAAREEQARKIETGDTGSKACICEPNTATASTQSMFEAL